MSGPNRPSRLRDAVIVLLVSEVDKSIDFYTALGFQVRRLDDQVLIESGSLKMLLYPAWLPADVRPASGLWGGPHVDLYLCTDRADQLYHQVKSHAAITWGPVHRSGWCEFGTLDPDGYKIAVGGPAPTM